MNTSLPSVRTQLLADELLAALRRKGWTCSQAAEKLQCSVSKISRITNGARQPQADDLAMLLAVLDVPAADRKELLEFARAIDQTSWWHTYEVPTGARRRLASRLYAVAERLTSYETDVVSPVLQVPGYVRASMTDQASIDLNDEGKVRAKTWADLMETKPALVFFIRERILVDARVPTDVMCEQVHHLLRMSVLPNVTIRVVLEADSTASYSAFSLLEFARHPPVVHFDHVAAATFLEESQVVTDYRDVLKDLRQRALSKDETSAWLRQLAGNLCIATNSYTDNPTALVDNDDEASPATVHI